MPALPIRFEIKQNSSPALEKLHRVCLFDSEMSLTPMVGWLENLLDVF